MKFRAKKAFCANHHTHDSKAEAMRCDELHERQARGEITHLTVHPKFLFVIDGRQLKHSNGRRVGYTGDFQYFEGDSNVVEDVKPKSRLAISRDWPLRKAVFQALFPFIDLREIVDPKGR